VSGREQHHRVVDDDCTQGLRWSMMQIYSLSEEPRAANGA
jgi:hypothetical protein